MKFPFFTIFMMFLAWFSYKRMRATRKENETERKFWDREIQANRVRRKDLTNLPYIEIPLESLPLATASCDDVIADCEARIRGLSEEKILNLTGMSNTDLKLTYGAPNLTFLSQCDQNYVSLIRVFQEWGTRLHKLSYSAEAITVLEQALRWGSDLKATYVLLADLYRETGQDEKIGTLISYAGKLSSLMKEPILSHLNGL